MLCIIIISSFLIGSGQARRHGHGRGTYSLVVAGALWFRLLVRTSRMWRPWQAPICRASMQAAYRLTLPSRLAAKSRKRTRSVAICVTSSRCTTTPFRYRDRPFRYRPTDSGIVTSDSGQAIKLGPMGRKCLGTRDRNQ